MCDVYCTNANENDKAEVFLEVRDLNMESFGKGWI